MRPKRLAGGQRLMFALITVIALTSALVSGAGVGTEEVKAAAETKPIESQEAPALPIPQESQAQQQDSAASHHIEPKSGSPGPIQGSGPADKAAESAPVAQHAALADGKTAEVEAKAAGERKGRSEGEKPAAAAAAAAGGLAESSKTEASKTADKPADKQQPAKSGDSKGPSSSSAKPVKTSSASPLSAKSATKSKLPANLGTVTSTGSGGPALYMSKHDAYSAIAEKHGALAAHSSITKKADKRQMHSFGGIQKASGGIGDMLSPFKGVTDSGLARTLGASMRSIVKGKYALPAYAASALLGAVALMAFYESPISPLPVPPLPEPPVGRFPPEMPSLPVGVQVPFRGNQQQQQQQQYGQQNYNQRSYNPMQQGFMLQPAQQQGSQVLFPSAGQQQTAQQRQMTAANPVQQLAANLLSGGKQNAQRKSGLDYDQSSSRSFFSGSATGSPSQPNTHKSSEASSFLSYFGLGGDAISHLSSIESKGSNGAINSNNLSGSHIVNKVRSMLSRSPSSSSGASSSSASISAANANPWDQYQRMSFVQALMKDAAFLPGYLTPSRKSSSASPAAASSPNKATGAAPATSSASASIAPASRMQMNGADLPLGLSSFMQPQQASGMQQQQQQAVAPKPQKSASGYGLTKVAHALLDTFTSGIMQRHSAPSLSGQQKSAHSEDSISPLVSATSLLTDMLSSYNAAQSGVGEQQQQASTSNEQQVRSAPSQSAQQSAAAQSQGAKPDQLSARSLEVGAPAEASAESSKQQVAGDKQPAAAPSAAASQQQEQPAQAQPQQQHVRKTRSIGLEYPIESNSVLEQQPQQPSKAAQINNVIDYVSESYSQNRMLFNFVMNQVGLSHAVPYVDRFLAPSGQQKH